MQAAQLQVGPGIVLRPTVIKPMFQKHGGKLCGAVQVHVTDRWAARSLRMTTALLVAARKVAPDEFGWRTERYEYVTDRLAIDLLYGSTTPRTQIEAGASTDEVLEGFIEAEAEFRARRAPYLLY